MPTRYEYTPPLDDPAARVPFQHSGPFTSGNYFVRHWRGENTLAYSYWVNGVLLSIPFKIGEHLPWARFGWAYLWAYLAISLCFYTWLGVGVWRAATHYSKAFGWGWGTVAKAMVLIALGGLALAINNAAKQGVLY